jgi:hypothetical protein
VLADNQDFGLRNFLANERRGLDATHPRHAHIEENKIRFELLCLFNGFHAVCSFATNFPLDVALDERAERTTHCRMIVCDQYS